MTALVLYCERALRNAPHTWLAEPLNVVSNIAYIVVGLWAIRYAHDDRPLKHLARVAIAVGLGSAAFHAAATPLAMVADVVPIATFVAASWWLLRPSAALQEWRIATGILLGVTIAAIVVQFQSCRPQPQAFFALKSMPGYCLSGGIAYVGAVFAMALAAVLARSNLKASRWFVGGAISLAGSLALRSFDPLACPLFAGALTSWNGGIVLTTHTLWHFGTAITMLTAICALRAARETRNERPHPNALNS